MLTKISDWTQGALLQEELRSGEANFRTLAEAIAGAIFITQGKRRHYVDHAAEIISGYWPGPRKGFRLEDASRAGSEGRAG